MQGYGYPGSLTVEEKFRSLSVSEDPEPIAYLITVTPSPQRSKIFSVSINPTVIAPIWAFQSVNSGTDRGFGFTFGEDFSVIYHVSYDSAASKLILQRMASATGSVQWSQGIANSAAISTCFLDSFVASASTSYVFITGISAASFHRLTISAGVVTASNSYADLINTGLVPVATFVVDQSDLSVLFYSPSFNGKSDQIVLGQAKLTGAFSTITYKQSLP